VTTIRRRMPVAAGQRRRVEAVRPVGIRYGRLPKQPEVPAVWRNG
jgi:hypothetical protein